MPAEPGPYLARRPELGGKAPVVVFDDVDVAAAVEGILYGPINNQNHGFEG
jgi:hypothetical protein